MLLLVCVPGIEWFRDLGRVGVGYGAGGVRSEFLVTGKKTGTLAF